jgi:predicted AAA+ superfamily ATPase
MVFTVKTSSFAADPLFQLESRLAGNAGALVLDEVQCVPEAFAALRGDILEHTFLLRRLPPYFRNVGKRLVKAPKVYLRDSGLLHHLLNLGTLDEVRNHPVHGASWETFVLEDVIRRERLRHPHAQFFFWRTADGAEIDLVVERGSARVAVEIKAGRGDQIHAARVLARAMHDVDARTGWILDQAGGTDQLRPGLVRRGFAADPEWLP